MVLCMLLTIFPTGAFANENSGSVGATATSSTVVDTDTKDEYNHVLGAADSTQYDGRVWVDKTVSDKSITFTKENGGEAFSVEKSDDEDFLVTYSTLANTSGLQIVPEDKVSDTIFVLDFSMTMNRNMDNINPSLADNPTVDKSFLKDTRIYTMLNAMDETIDTLKKANPENRVGIVTFYGYAKVLLPLKKLGDIGEVTGPTEDNVDKKTVNYTTPNNYFSILGYKGHDGNNNKSWVQCNITGNINELSDYTSMQSGVYAALDMFRGVLSDGTPKDRQANVIVITDGESNTLARAVEGKNWYEELSTDNDRNWNVTNFTNNVFATILTASYLKEYVGKMYADGCEIYTVGLLKGQDMTNMQSLLDPGRYLDEESEQPQIIKDVLNLWNQYNSDSGPYPTIGGIEFSPAPDPNVENEILPSTLDYADAFYNAENASQLANAFQEITSNLIVSNPKPPTETGGGDSTKSGYITFTDPLGKYMEVKDVKCIIFDDEEFIDPIKTEVDDKTTRYTFSGTVDNPASSTGVASVADILIDVTQEDAGHQTVTIQIPASVVPLRSNTVYLKSGEPIRLTTKDHYPMRIVYSVGLQDEVTQEWLEKNDPTYLKENTEIVADGNRVVNFYANLFDEENKVTDDDGTEKTLGNATATFTADTSNPFYYAQKGSVLYVDEDGTKVPAAGSFSSGTTYYVKHDYYYKVGDQLKHEETWLGRSDLTEDNVEQDNGQLILKEDMLKQADLASARTEKTNAVGNTADYSYYAIALDEDETDQVAEGSFLAYLGNNGKLSLKLSEPEKSLTIPVEKVWNDQDNQDNQRPSTITVSLLKNGEDTGLTLELNEENDWEGTFTVENPDENATYSVKETDVPENYTSTMTGNQTTGFIITNTYMPTETQEKRISVEKVWQDENNKDGIRPGSVTVELIKDGAATGETLTLNEDNGWKGTFVIKDYDEDAKYTVQEKPVPDGYKCVVTGDAENGFTITNTHSPKPDPVPDDPDPGEDDDPPDTPDDLNTVDHYLYIEGYPEDYRTGEESWDESVWPVKPQGNITRAEVATIFYRLLKDEVREEIETDENNFPDVNEGDWFNVTVSSLANMGAVGGYEDGTFRPNKPITRAELLAMAVRFFEAFETIYEPGTFTDVTGDEWYATAIAAAKELGIISGYPDGTVRPEANITRAETCAIVNRVLDRRPHDEHIGDVEDMRTWPDNLPGAWYYADMQEATNGHYYEWIDIDGSKFEEWTEVDKDYDWTKR